ncbi:MAG: hypothetical protein FJX74_16450 [Armatimonadetes bacterium]|nr:hypothetical protein [Armatimonadota bacterium]
MNSPSVGSALHPRRLGLWGATLLALAARGLCAGGLFEASGHGDTTTGVLRASTQYARGECAHCHEAHAGQDADPTLYPYALFAGEENVCWACHQGGVTYAADARVGFATTPPNTPTDYYKHPVSQLFSGTTPSAHRSGEKLPGAFSGGNRHAECVDCHDPHAAANDGTPGSSTHTPGGATGNRLSGALLGTTGIVVAAWQGAGLPFSSASYSLRRLTDPATTYEWQVCFKCHSSFTTLPTFASVGSGDFTASKITSLNARQVKEYQDVGRAFNPNNLAYHPVTAQGRNSSIPTASFTAPWTATSTMCCSDCHTKASGAPGAAGPHGSTNMHILERPVRLRENTHYFDPSWGENIGHDPNELCFKCHRWQTYVQKEADPSTNTGFRDGGDNLHTKHMGDFAPGATCYTCHDVHGTNKQHLINFNLDYVTSPAGSQAGYAHAANGGSCVVTCHGEFHDGLTYSR